MDPDVTDELITFIYKHPAIWKRNHVDYKHKWMINCVWEKLKGQLNMEVPVLKKKWKYLKDQYRKELKKFPEPHNPQNHHRSVWQYFMQMDFLRAEMLQTFTDISFDTIENDDSNSEHENNQPQYPNSPEPNAFVEVSPHDPLLSKSDPEAHPILRGSLKRKMAEDVKKDSGGSEKKRASQNQSDDYHYLMSLLPDMESFTGVQKYRVRNKINQVIMDELWMLRGRVE